jgi:hypothetical protein
VGGQDDRAPRAGDVVNRVNHHAIEKPEQAHAVWTALRSGREISVELIRAGQTRSLTFRWRPLSRSERSERVQAPGRRGFAAPAPTALFRREGSAPSRGGEAALAMLLGG